MINDEKNASREYDNVKKLTDDIDELNEHISKVNDRVDEITGEKERREQELALQQQVERAEAKGVTARVISGIALSIFVLAFLILLIAKFGYDESKPMGALRAQIFNTGHPFSSILIRAEVDEDYKGKNQDLGLSWNQQVYKITFCAPEKDGVKIDRWVITQSPKRYYASVFIPPA